MPRCFREFDSSDQTVQRLLLFATLSVLVSGCHSTGFSGYPEIWRTVVDKAETAVVTLYTRPGGRLIGSGWLAEESGLILTSGHVVSGHKEFVVRFADGVTANAELLDRQDWVDVAALRVPTSVAEDRRPLQFTRWGSYGRGSFVAAVGSPCGFPFSITTGVIAGLDRTVSEKVANGYIQHTAMLLRGNAGGALVDRRGEVVGMNTAPIDDVPLFFAVPVDVLVRYVGEVLSHGSHQHGGLGVRVHRLTSNLTEALDLSVTDGLLVASVAPGSTAGRAGVVVGDVIIAINGEKLSNPRTLGERLWVSRIGEEIELDVLRNGRPLLILTRLGPAEAITGRFMRDDSVRVAEPPLFVGSGMTIGRRVTPGGAPHMVVTDVHAEGLAASVGIVPGDRVVTINNELVDSPDRTQTLLDSPTSGVIVILIEQRSGRQHYVVLDALAVWRQDEGGSNGSIF